MNSKSERKTIKQEKDKPDYINKSLDKALSILDLFDSHDSELSATEIAQGFEVNPGSLYPILHTLENHGYLKRDEDKLYSLGLVFAQKGSLVLERLNIAEEARPELEKLRDETKKTVHLGYFNENQVVYIDKVESRGGIRMYSSPGKSAPLHATALGKVTLAFLPDEQLEEIISSLDLEPFTDETVTSPDKLREELETIKKQGYAVDDEEFEKGIKCIAIPIYNHSGKVKAAISVTGLSAQTKVEEISPLIKRYGEEISAKLGFKA
ncbi:IclR family transcriptional regulator [Candidatus Bipolaricaulota bacterium]|nr:IclR family transcriptional regulator [Candidatus Bipolaricaulota bacterium]